MFQAQKPDKSNDSMTSLGTKVPNWQSNQELPWPHSNNLESPVRLVSTTDMQPQGIHLKLHVALNLDDLPPKLHAADVFSVNCFLFWSLQQKLVSWTSPKTSPPKKKKSKRLRSDFDFVPPSPSGAGSVHGGRTTPPDSARPPSSPPERQKQKHYLFWLFPPLGSLEMLLFGAFCALDYAFRWDLLLSFLLGFLREKGFSWMGFTLILDRDFFGLWLLLHVLYDWSRLWGKVEIRRLLQLKWARWAFSDFWLFVVKRTDGRSDVEHVWSVGFPFDIDDWLLPRVLTTSIRIAGQGGFCDTYDPSTWLKYIYRHPLGLQFFPLEPNFHSKPEPILH